MVEAMAPICDNEEKTKREKEANPQSRHCQPINSNQ